MFLVRVYDVKLVKPREVERRVAVHVEHIEVIGDEEEEKTRILHEQNVERIVDGVSHLRCVKHE